MKRFQLFLVGAFVAAGPLFAQSADADWHSEVAKVKELIQANPAQASEEAAQLLKGKNKKYGSSDCHWTSLFGSR